MGFFDNLLAPFGTGAQDKASQDLIDAYQRAYGQATPLFEQARGAITQGRDTAIGAYSPFLSQGQNAVTALGNATGANGPAGNTAALSAFTGGPSYQFNLDQMTQNLLRAQEATGQANSGATNNDILKLTSGYAGNQWQNYIGNLMGLAGIGAGAAGGTAGAAMGAGTGLANSFTNQGSAAYGTQVGEGNAQAQADLAPLTAGKNLWGLGTNLLQLGAGSPISGGFLGPQGGGGGYGGYGGGGGGGGGFNFGGMFNTLSPYLSGASPSYQNGGIYPQYAEGGRPDPGQPAIVGENGPEVFVPDQPGTIVPNNQSDDMLSRLHREYLARRGIETASSDQSPTATGADIRAEGLGMVDPLGLTSYAAGKVSPELRARMDAIREASPEGYGAGEMMTPANDISAGLISRGAGLVGRLARAYPEVAAGAGAGAGLLAGTAEAGNEPPVGTRPTATDDEQRQLDAYDARIAGLTNAKAQAMLQPKVMNAPLSVKQATAKTYDDQIAALQQQKAGIGNLVLKRQGDYDAQQAEFARNTAPFAERHPDWATALSLAPALSPMGGGLVGAAAGRTVTPMKRLAAYAAGTGGGALEGAIAAAAPEVVDMRMGRGTKAREEAETNLRDPAFWGAGAIESGFGAGLGALGAKYGMLRFGQAAPANAGRGASRRALPTRQPASAGGVFQSSAGWHEQGTGAFVSRNDPRVQAATQRGNPPAQTVP